jgi:regulator of nucleoside diphosphate kinase
MFNDFMRPEITLGDAEHRRLLVLAMTASGHTADDTDYLHHELDRARLVPDDEVPADTVRMGSIVVYRTDTGQRGTVEIVPPSEHDAARGRMSVVSPVGAALIGLRAGQSITRMGWDGAFCTFTVLSAVGPRAQ